MRNHSSLTATHGRLFATILGGLSVAFILTM